MGAGAVLTPRGSQEAILECRILAFSQPNSLTLLPARSALKPLNANDQVIKQLAEFTRTILSLDNHLAGILSMLIFLRLAESACWGWHCSAKLTSGFHRLRIALQQEKKLDLDQLTSLSRGRICLKEGSNKYSGNPALCSPQVVVTAVAVHVPGKGKLSRQMVQP